MGKRQYQLSVGTLDYRFRIRSPEEFRVDTFERLPKQWKPRIDEIIGKLKTLPYSSDDVLQAIVFPKRAGWTPRKVRRWLRRHYKSETGELLEK